MNPIKSFLSSLPLVPFYFMRHGETDWNLEGRIMGQTDIPLNSTGIEQAKVAATKLHGIQFEAIVTSPLSRAQKTAEIIAEAHSKSLYILERLKEVGSGRKQGKQEKEWLQDWIKGDQIEGVESIMDFTSRIVNAISYALISYKGPILIVSHGGVYWALFKALQFPPHKPLNCQIICHYPPKCAGEPWQVSLRED